MGSRADGFTRDNPSDGSPLGLPRSIPTPFPAKGASANPMSNPSFDARSKIFAVGSEIKGRAAAVIPCAPLPVNQLNPSPIVSAPDKTFSPKIVGSMLLDGLNMS